jgi:hypothetical protein
MSHCEFENVLPHQRLIVEWIWMIFLVPSEPDELIDEIITPVYYNNCDDQTPKKFLATIGRLFSPVEQTADSFYQGHLT